MSYVPLEHLMRSAKSLFKLVLAASERANEIGQGAPPLVRTGSKKATTMALDEFAAGKVHYIDLAAQEKPSEIPTSGGGEIDSGDEA